MSLIQIERKGAQIIAPFAQTFKLRYSNLYTHFKGSRIINNVSCPLCDRYLRNNDCGNCPMDEAFGAEDKVSLDRSGCKEFIRMMWGPIQFGDFPNCIIRSERVNTQLQRINQWLMTVFR